MKVLAKERKWLPSNFSFVVEGALMIVSQSWRVFRRRERVRLLVLTKRSGV